MVAGGTVVVAGGTVVVAGGTVVVSGGTVVGGTVVVAGGTVVGGTVVVCGGTVVVVGGTVVVGTVITSFVETYPVPEKLFVLGIVAPNVLPDDVENEFELTPPKVCLLYTSPSPRD